MDSLTSQAELKVELNTITVKGFKSIAAIENLPLRALNVLIGSNGSGKSNFIGVFSFLHAIREGHLRETVIKAGGADKLLHFGSKTTEKMEFFISFANELNQYFLELSQGDEDNLYPSSEWVSFWGDRSRPEPYTEAIQPRDYTEGIQSRERGQEAGLSDPEALKILKWVRLRIDRWRVYHFHDTSSDSPMKKTAALNDNRYLRPDAANLASFLYLLRQKHPAEYGLIRNTIRLVAPFFDDFQLEPTALNPNVIRLEWRHKNSENYFDAASLSDGTLRFIALTTLFLQPTSLRPSIILLDEPELGLHPFAINKLASLIKQAATKTQVIVSTQSPLLLDYFEPEDVLVADRVNGATQLKRLDAAQLEEWLKEYSLGELWEKNELGGRPAHESISPNGNR